MQENLRTTAGELGFVCFESHKLKKFEILFEVCLYMVKRS